MSAHTERCDNCGRFGARKNVQDKGPNGLGGRQTETHYLCRACEAKYLAWLVEEAK
jgi:ribosomal protein L37AE/L43A